MENSGNKKIEKTFYYKSNVDIPSYLPYPRFLIGMDLKPTTKLVYAILLNRVLLSDKNNWRDSSGRIFIVYSIENLSKDLRRGKTVIKDALKELEDANLLERCRRGVGNANYLYVKVPEHSRETDDQAAAKEASKQPENWLPNSHKTGNQAAAKPAGNNLISNNYDKINLSEPLSQPETMPYGYNNNIFLTKEEYDILKLKYPDDLDRYITEMSLYLISTGKAYKNYFTALQRWAEKDLKKPKYFDPEKYYQGRGDGL